MENVWLVSLVWLGLALLASVISIRAAMSLQLLEIMVGAAAGNDRPERLSEHPLWLRAILPTFLAGTEINSRGVRKHFWPRSWAMNSAARHQQARRT